MSLNIVLFQPEIARNTGNIMRTCVALGAQLHLIKPLGFDLNDKHVRRSATYHIPLLDYHLYESYEEFERANAGAYFFMTRHATQPPSAVDFTAFSEGEIYLIFGRESTGLPHAMLAKHKERCFRLPMTQGTRSLNLSNAVCVCGYEVMRQLDYKGLSLYDDCPQDGPESFDEFSR